MKTNKMGNGWWNRLLPIVACLLEILGMVALIFLFKYSKELGYFFLPALLLLFGVLLYILGQILMRRDKEWMLSELGEEQYYKKFPREKKRIQRKERKEAQKRERMARKTGQWL